MPDTIRALRFTLIRATLAVLLAAVAAPVALHAQDADVQDATDGPQAVLAAKDWVAPPDVIADAVLAPRHLNVTLSNISPDKTRFLVQLSDGPVTMDRFSLPFDELGGQFFDFRANRNRNLTIRNSVGIRLIAADDGSTTEVEVPNGARVSNASWSPDGSQVAFFVHEPDATHIHVADAENGDSRRVTRTPVLATFVTSFEWTGSGGEIATVLIPEDRSTRPLAPRVPAGPQVKQTEEGDNVLRTYASLMATPHDEELLEWHVTGQLAVIDVESRTATTVGEPAMIRSFDFSPDGRHARVTTMRRPFSYIVPVTSFGRVEEVWDRNGAVLVELDVTELNTGLRGAPAAPGVAGEEEEPDRRQLAWRADGAGLTFLQMEPAPDEEDDADDTAADTEDDEEDSGPNRRMDRVMLWSPPFDDASMSTVFESSNRISSHRFSPDHDWLFLTQRPGGGGGGFGGGAARGGKVREYAVDLADPDTEHTLVEYDSDDFYANPGSLVMETGRVAAFARFGGGGGGSANVLLSSDGGSVFFAGTQYHEDPLEEGPKAFLDRVVIATGDKERIYEGSNEDVSERLSVVLDADMPTMIVNRSSPTEIGQSFLVGADGDAVRLTNNVDYTPDVTMAPRERFTVERPDGFRFLVNVTLPPDYREGERRPAMFWFYPREYEDQESYDERGRTFDKNSFPGFGTRSMEYLVRLGYVVVEPDAPIVGEAGRMNNNYEHDLRNNLAAVIDELDRRGYIDRQRLGLGGHSYGAFGTVNAMVHTPFFKAGIAGDGNYNRTFTPLGFQSERRHFWDAREVYLGMSPFVYANNLTGALLMYHGLNDQNVGTAPDHSPRLFHALNGLGKDAAMYLYPFEGHGPATRETILDLWARWTAWLDVHLGEPTQPIT